MASIFEARSYKAQDWRRWTPRTLADREAEATGRAFSECACERVTCTCGRRVPAAVIVDTSHFPAEVWNTLGVEPRSGACDACRSAWIRSGRLDKIGWLRACGAPPELVDEHQRRAHTDPRRRRVP